MRANRKDLSPRLEAQLLGRRAPDVITVARRLLALQGQDFNGVQWALAVRTRAPSRPAVHAAFDSGALVRAWPMRGTLHVTAAEDLAWLSRLTAERVLAKAKTRQAQLGLTSRDFTRARDVAEQELEAGPKTRAQILAAFERAKLSTAGQRGYHLLWTLALQHVVCWGPMRGKEQALVLQARWLPKTEPLERDEALGRLATRYLEGHGPATLGDLTWWCGLTRADVKRGLEVAGIPQRGELLDVERKRATATRGDRVVLLPAFDEWFLGYADRSALIDAEFLPRVAPGGIFQPLLVERGRVIGTWKREVRGARVSVKLLPFVGRAPAVDLTTLTRFFAG